MSIIKCYFINKVENFYKWIYGGFGSMDKIWVDLNKINF